MVTHDFPPKVGGIASHVYQLSKELVRLNNEIFILTPNPHNDNRNKFATQDGIHVFYLQHAPHSRMLPRINNLTALNYAVKANLKLRKLITDNAINLVHYHNIVPESLVTKRIKKIPVVFTAHESHLLNLAKMNKKRLYFYLSHPQYLIAPSQELLDKAKQYGNFPKGASYIPNAVDPDTFFPASTNGMLEELGLKENEPLVLSARRLEEKNGVEYTIRALPYILRDQSNTKLIIIGDGSQRSYLKALSKKLKVEKSILWLGAKSNFEMPRFYNLAKVVVLPSLKEATSITGLEAMACEKPLVGTTVGGIPNLIVDNETGYLVPPRQPREMAEKVIWLLQHPQRAQEFGRKARERILQDFCWSQVARKTMSVYESLS